MKKQNRKQIAAAPINVQAEKFNRAGLDYLLSQEEQDAILFFDHAAFPPVLDVSKHNLKHIVRVCVKQQLTFSAIQEAVMLHYLKTADRSESQRALKDKDPGAYAQSRAIKILGDILKEQGVIDTLGKKYSVKEYRAR